MTELFPFRRTKRYYCRFCNAFDTKMRYHSILIFSKNYQRNHDNVRVFCVYIRVSVEAGEGGLVTRPINAAIQCFLIEQSKFIFYSKFHTAQLYGSYSN